MNPINPREAKRLLEKLGFVEDRNSGGHIVYKHPDGRTCVMADPGRAVKQSTDMRRSLKQAGVKW